MTKDDLNIGHATVAKLIIIQYHFAQQVPMSGLMEPSTTEQLFGPMVSPMTRTTNAAFRCSADQGLGMTCPAQLLRRATSARRTDVSVSRN